MYRYCQVCGNPIVSAQSHGTEADGRYSRDFCSNCYKGGQFNDNLAPSGNGQAMYSAMPYYPGMYGYMGYNLH